MNNKQKNLGKREISTTFADKNWKEHGSTLHRSQNVKSEKWRRFD